MSPRIPTLMVWLLCSAGSIEAATDGAQEPAIIPAPASMELTGGTFTVQNDTMIVVDNDPSATRVAHYFGDLLLQSRQLRPAVVQAQNAGALKKVIRFTLQQSAAADPESYQLEINSKGIAVSAFDPKGLLYGATTLWQILSSDTESKDGFRVPALRIADAPRLKWRGLMLDSAHRYQSPEFIKRYIDAMVLHKLNVLHWYLADDEAWRIEIRKFPKLAAREAYSQRDIAELVAYAAQRNVTMVPGISLPSHAGAMIAAYPQLGSASPAPAASTHHMLNTDETTFAFIGDVLSEVAQLFPGEYIHIGSGDYSTAEWHSSARAQARMRELGLISEGQMQSYFVDRVATLARERGRRVIGWDLPISTSDSAALGMSSRGLDGALTVTGAGMNVIVGSFTQLDFNHPQGFGLADEPAGVGDVVRVEDIYAFDPAPVALAAEDLGKLVGVQANVWTEQSRTENDVALITFPRAAALAEIAWSPYARQRWANFVDRLVSCVQRYDQLAIRHSDAAYRVSFALREVMPSGQVRVELSQQISSGEIRYTLDDSEPTARSPMYKDILNVRTPISMRAATFVNGEKISSTSRIELAKDSIAANGARN